MYQTVISDVLVPDEQPDGHFRRFGTRRAIRWSFETFWNKTNNQKAIADVLVPDEHSDGHFNYS